jgi:hypothetical protein
MIETFVSRPNWAPPNLEQRLDGFYQLLQTAGFKANTIGKSQASLKTPFDDVRRLMKKCKCTIVMGLPQVFIETGSFKDRPISKTTSLSTEWNQIETTMSLMMDLPTLVLLHKDVTPRGIFDRGAANVFVYEFDTVNPTWLQDLQPALATLKEEVDA